jgi:hypothetical protein
MLFRFIISFGIADFRADRNFHLTVEAFSFHFKCLNGSSDCLSTLPRHARYGVAVLDELAVPLWFVPSYQSIYFGRKVTCCPRQA